MIMFASPRSNDGWVQSLSAARRFSRPFASVAMGSRFAKLNLPTTKIEVPQRAFLRPCLVQPIDTILRLDSESLQGQKHGPNRDHWRRSWPDVTALEASHPRSLDSTGDDDLLDQRLETVP